MWLCQAKCDFHMLTLAHMPSNSTAEAAQGCWWCVDALAKLINTEWRSSAISQSLWGLEGSRNDPCTIACDELRCGVAWPSGLGDKVTRNHGSHD